MDNIDQVVSGITQLLSSRTVSDVQESIDIFLTLNHYRVESSGKGIRKMLVLTFLTYAIHWGCLNYKCVCVSCSF